VRLQSRIYEFLCTNSRQILYAFRARRPSLHSQVRPRRLADRTVIALLLGLRTRRQCRATASNTVLHVSRSKFAPGSAKIRMGTVASLCNVALTAPNRLLISWVLSNHTFGSPFAAARMRCRNRCEVGNGI